MDTFQHKSFLNEFQKIVKKYPESIAISTESEKISYQELDLRVTQVSYQLHGDGIRDGDVVALWMNKSPEYIVFILAIWKLNAVFLPIDAKTPELRVDWICENADVKLLVTDSQVFNNSGLVQLRSPTEQKLYSLNLLTLVRHIPQVRSEISDQGKFYSSMNVAYIIYTSGSTGNPKGVVGSHEGIVNFLEKQIEVFRVSPKSKILQYLSIGFDASLSEIGIALLSGSEIRIEEDSKLKSIDRLIEILEKERITHICLPPALLPLFPIQKIPSTLETVIIGGEVCPVETVRKWANKVRLVNVYGPTEATVCSSLIVCGSNWDKPLIGSPITGREFHILDETLSEVKIGESGELYLSGVGLALEYLGLPKLTKEKFLLLNGIRMYKTGDLVLKHSSEKIEFLGRVDRQFKHRGNLVEPFEVEQALTAMKGISFALVKKEKLHREVLVAYIQYSKSEPEEKQRAISILEIKSSLKKHYPSWMVPQKFIVLEKIPLNLNEKLDITSLPKLENSRPSYLSSYREPTTELEQKLCFIFEKILFVKPVGIKDDFYELGGDSISMISLLTECGLQGIYLSVEKFIQNPTVSGIVNQLALSQFTFRNVENLEKEASLDSEITEVIQKSITTNVRFSKILITGVTGFLGSRILYEISNTFNAEIYCIVRNLKTNNPREKIEEFFYKQNIEIQNWDRIHFLEGDITKPNLGLSLFHWDFLANKVDTVFHFAAEVNLISDYETLKKANVDATLEILRFCNTKTRKHLHYASTLSVFVSSDDVRSKFYETDLLDSMKEVYGGYAQSKWVSEKILLNAKKLGMDLISIYRFGLITGDSKTGISKEGDFFSSFLQTLIQIKKIPNLEQKEIQVDITPIDYAAKACITLSQNSKPSIFHIANQHPLSLSRLVSILEDLGISISQVSSNKFIETCKSLELEKSYFYLSLSRLFLGKREFTLIRPLDLFQRTDVEFDFTNTNGILSKTGLVCPYPHKDLLERYIRELN